MLPIEARLLYFELGMHADDDGFVQPGLVLRMSGLPQSALAILTVSGLVYQFGDGIVVIMDWKTNNSVRGDRYKPTQYQDHYDLLPVLHKERRERLKSGSDSLLHTNGIPLVDKLDTQDRLGKDRDISKDISNTESEKKVNEAFEYWEERIGPITVTRESQRKACVAIQNKYGIDACQKMIRVVEHAHSNKYARKEVKCLTPLSLQTNWDKVLIYAKGVSGSQPKHYSV